MNSFEILIDSVGMDIIEAQYERFVKICDAIDHLYNKYIAENPYIFVIYDNDITICLSMCDSVSMIVNNNDESFSALYNLVNWVSFSGIKTEDEEETGIILMFTVTM